MQRRTIKTETLCRGRCCRCGRKWAIARASRTPDAALHTRIKAVARAVARIVMRIAP
jgi:hypothetical protein